MATKISAGTRYARLIALSPVANDAPGRSWLFKCDCGTEKVLSSERVRIGRTQSCGCLRIHAGRANGRLTKHGHSNSPTYRSWMHMLSRCNNPKMHAYADYGGRGIRACERWGDFRNFLADMGERPSLRHSLDRYPNNDGNYEPGNCRWSTMKQQHRNRRGNHIVEYRQRKMPLAEAIELSGLDSNAVRARLRSGWNLSRALTEPIKNRAAGQRNT